jgi:hypothetical protein
VILREARCRPPARADGERRRTVVPTALAHAARPAINMKLAHELTESSSDRKRLLTESSIAREDVRLTAKPNSRSVRLQPRGRAGAA